MLRTQGHGQNFGFKDCEFGRDAHHRLSENGKCTGASSPVVIYRAPLMQLPNKMARQGPPLAYSELRIHRPTGEERPSNAL